MSFGDSKLSKYNHEKSLQKMNKSIDAIKTRRPRYDSMRNSAIILPSKTKNLRREYQIEQQNKMLQFKLSEVKGGVYSIMKDVWKNQETKNNSPRMFKHQPFKDKQNNRIKLQNQRLEKVIKEQRQRKRIF